MTDAAWFVNAFRNDRASRSLYCFPFAGGSASYYARWAACFTEDIEPVPVQLPGREARIAEPPATSITEVADVVAALIVDAPTRPLLFGHSMGAIIAFEVARRLQTLGRPAECLFVSGRPAPWVPRPVDPVSTLPKAGFIQVLRDYGAIAEEILNHHELLGLLMPMMRADFAMIERYSYVDGPRLAHPVLAWCGDSDPDVTPDAMAGWARVTTGEFQLHTRSGGHFFVTEHYPEIAATVHRKAAAARS